MPKKKSPVVISVRFTGKSLNMYEEIISMQEAFGVSCNEIMRSLMLIGLQAYKKGAVAGFDGKVVLADEVTEEPTAPAPEKIEKQDPTTMKSKTSSFLE